MKERVTIINGNNPIILVCPHGPDDTNTSIITKVCAKEVDCSAIINNGWKRTKNINESSGRANCNSATQVLNSRNSVLFSEYGAPLLRMVADSLVSNSNSMVFHIHGVGDHISINQPFPIGFVMGFGQSKKKPSHTCPLWLKNSFAEYVNYDVHRGYAAAQGRKGGNYCARRKDNMAQHLKLTYENSNYTLHNLQLEINYELREDKSIAEETGKYLAGFLKMVLNSNLQSTGHVMPNFHKVPVV